MACFGPVRGRVVAVALAGVLCVGASVWATEGADARSLYRDAIRAYRAGKTDEAVAGFKQSEKADPSYPYPVFALARLYQENYETTHRGYADAADRYDRLTMLLRIDPPSERERALYQAHYFRGLLCLKGGEYVNALESLREFLDVYPDYYSPEQVHNAIGVALYYLQRYDEAAEAFRRATATRPDFVEARVNLRSVFSRLSLYNEALANARSGNLEHALDRVALLRRVAPAYLPGRQLEANLLRDTGKPMEALRVYREILATDPSHPSTHDVRLEAAKILESTGRARAALELLNEDLQWFRSVDSARTQTMKEILRLVEQLRTKP